MKIKTLCVAVFLLSGCARSVWQQPDRVLRTLAVARHAHVADLGAGDGYFTFRLADVVGSKGRVYAVDVDPESLDKLRKRAKARGYKTIEAVRADPHDSKLPAKSVDLVFICNVYHEIDARQAYFARLRSVLREGGRVAIIELRDDASGLAGLFVPSDHTTPLALIRREMKQAGYRVVASYGFLSAQSFTVFEPAP